MPPPIFIAPPIAPPIDGASAGFSAWTLLAVSAVGSKPRSIMPCPRERWTSWDGGSAGSRIWMSRVVRASLPFLAVLFVFLIMVTYIPIISTFLPNTFMGPEIIIK